MNTTDNIMDLADAINCPASNQDSNDNFIENIFDDEGAFGEADCAGL